MLQQIIGINELRKFLVSNRADSFYIKDENGVDIRVNTISGSLRYIAPDEDEVKITMKDKCQSYTLRFSANSHRLATILACLTTDWSLHHLDDIVIDTKIDYVGYTHTKVWTGERLQKSHRITGKTDDEIRDINKDYVKIIIRALNFSPEELDLIGEKREASLNRFVTEDASVDFHSLSHKEALQYLRYQNGRNMFALIARSIYPRHLSAMAYVCRTEFSIGAGYVDAAVELFTFIERPPIRICCELKVSKADVYQDEKLASTYLSSKMFDYYFLVASTADVAQTALKKYESCPAIGVACLESGAVLKVPEQQTTTRDAYLIYRAEVHRRKRESISTIPIKTDNECLYDNQVMCLMLNDVSFTIFCTINSPASLPSVS